MVDKRAVLLRLATLTVALAGLVGQAAAGGTVSW